MNSVITSARYHLITLTCVALLLQGCSSLSSGLDENGTGKLTVLYTNDEHGWMEGMEEGRGAANLFELWQEKEGFTPDGDFLVLSGGDNWTGPAISTWVEGQSMVELMNAMDYDASAVGNHEFDFGLDDFTTRANEANYPYLSANTVWKDSNDYAVDLGILPYTVKSVAGLKVAIIGLTTTSTSTSTMPSVVAPLAFTNYETALRRVMPEVLSAEPDLLMVISHVCMRELRPLAAAVADLNISLIGAGHCNELVAEKIGDTVILGGGFHFGSYAKAELQVDSKSKETTSLSYSTHDNAGYPADSGIGDIVSRWREVSEETLSESLGFSGEEYAASSVELEASIVESWLDFDTAADVALTNAGGIRTALGAGEITLGSIVAIMPFANTIVALNLTGAQLAEVMVDATRPVVAGIIKRDNRWLLSSTNEPLDMSANYRVLVNSFMYDGGDGYQLLAEFDPNGFDTAVHYREPFVQWLKKMNSSAEQPLLLD